MNMGCIKFKNQYGVTLKNKLKQSQQNLQIEVRQQDQDLFFTFCIVWLQNRRHKQKDYDKLQQKFVELHEVLKTCDNHTYEIGSRSES